MRIAELAKSVPFDLEEFAKEIEEANLIKYVLELIKS
jgi:hypothetical protein